jgi:hypothetical protein
VQTLDLTGNNALHQGNDETIQITISAVSAAEDLSAVTSLTAVFKPSVCDADTSEHALILSSTDATEIVITSQTPDLIVAEVYVPGSYTVEPYDRVWHVDAYTGVVGAGPRTAIHGAVEVQDI